MPLRLKDQIYATVNSDAAYNGTYKLTFPNKAGTLALTSDLPTVNDATLTIQKNGTDVQTFSANQSSNATANITVPTDTNDLTNGAGFVTGSITKANSGTLGTTTIDSTTANYMEVTKLSTATDLNTIKTTGIYIIAATPTNSPTGAWGTMYVDWTTGTKYQIYINDGVSGNIFKRSWNSSNSTWTSWVRITSADISNIERYYRGLVPLGTAVAANKNLNTTEFLKVGKYYCSTDATVATLTNCPTDKAFMMEVFSPLSTTIDNETTAQWVYRVRILTTYTGLMYIQKASSGSTAGNFTYGAWSQFAYTSNLDAKPNSYWGTSTTAAATAAKVVTVASAQNFKLVPGAMVTFTAPNTNTANNPTINVNSTGAKPVFFNNAVVTTSNLNKAGQNGRPATYVYDGTNWVWVSWSADDNTTYSTMSVAEGQAGTATSARTVRADYLKQIIEYYNPTVNDATLTIQKNGSNVATFTANSATNQTANITVPNLQTSNTDPGEGAALAADTFLGVYDVAPSAIDGARITDGTITPAKTTFTTYSTTEKAVGEWIDGKTIYRKTISVGALPNNASKNTAHGISNLDTVIDCRGFAKATWGTQYPIPTVYASGDAGYNTQVSVDATNITLSCTGNNSGKSGYVTIWYTKSS